jgi:arsenate reductase
MAEALVNADLGETWQAFSAGTHPAGYVQPLALRVLEELGIRHAGVSKSTEGFRGAALDVVITVCDDAAENCPLWLGQGKRVHIGFPDPSHAPGSEEERLAAFREVRDAIRLRVEAYLQAYTQEADGR